MDTNQRGWRRGPPVMTFSEVGMTYRERRERKAERLREWAEKRQEEASATLQRDRETYGGDVAFNTQPGHIPLRARVIARTDRAFASLSKAQSMESRAANIESQLDGAIYSDDPDAIEALKARIATLEAERDRIKAYNASCRKGAPDVLLLDEAQRRELKSVLNYAPYQIGKGGQFPSYHLQNLGGNITRNRQRLASLKAQS